MLLACSIKAALLLAATWAGVALLRRGTAAARHQVWTLGVVGAVLLPLLTWALPSLLAVPVSSTPATTLHGPAMFVTATSAAPSWPAWLAYAWLAGAVIVAARAVRDQRAARRLVRGATPIAGLDSAGVPVLRSAQITTPMTAGIVRPCVLLPAAADAWSPARIRAVLVHELGHVQRRDTASQLVAQVACALYWWNPLAWLAAARLRSEREHACDDLVLAAGILPSSYAADLLDVARSVARPHAGAICMVDQSWTEARLRRILDARTPRRPLRRSFRLATTGLALACAVTIACTSAPLAKPAPRGTLVVGTPSARGPITFRPPEVQAALDLADVTTEVQRRLGTLEQCYTRRLAAKPTLAGTVVIHWVLSETGEVQDQCITSDSVGDQQVVDCVNELVAAGPFPAPRGRASVDVSYPFVFSAR